MICPYRTIMNRLETKDDQTMQIVIHEEKIFAECMYNECPLYAGVNKEIDEVVSSRSRLCYRAMNEWKEVEN